MVCRGWPISHSVLSFGSQKVHRICSCQPPVKFFPVFTLDPHRPFLDWQLISVLISQPMTLSTQIPIEYKSDISDITTELSNTIFFKCSNVSSTNHQLTLNPIIDPSCHKWALYPPGPYPMSKITQLAISQRKKVHLSHIFCHFLWSIYGSKFKIPIAVEIWGLFWHLTN